MIDLMKNVKVKVNSKTDVDVDAPSWLIGSIIFIIFGSLVWVSVSFFGMFK